MRWVALIVHCIGLVLTMIDSTVVAVALPTIKSDFHLSDDSLVWVVNAYIIPYSGSLLISGQLGDVYGHRRIFLISVALFTLASLGCGMAHSYPILLLARAVQGVAGAAVSAVVLSLTLTIFERLEERAKALAILSAISCAGGSIGVFLGGLLTSRINWHWIFLINVPIGLAVCCLAYFLSPRTDRPARPVLIDLWGGATLTGSVMLATYEVLHAPAVTWPSYDALLGVGGAFALFGMFAFSETQTQAPLLPSVVIRDRKTNLALLGGVLWAAAMFTYSFVLPLFFQVMLHYDPMQVGMAVLPSSVIMAIVSFTMSDNLALRYGVAKTFATGTGLVAAGLLSFIRLPVNAHFAFDILPGTLLVAVGTGMAYNSWILAVTRQASQNHYGVVSGIANSAFIFGGALALSLITAMTTGYTRHALRSNINLSDALDGGYRYGLFIAALCAAAAALVGSLFFDARPIQQRPTQQEQ